MNTCNHLQNDIRATKTVIFILTIIDWWCPLKENRSIMSTILTDFYIFRIKNNWDNVIWVHKDAKKIELKKGTIKFEIGGATF